MVTAFPMEGYSSMQYSIGHNSRVLLYAKSRTVNGKHLQDWRCRCRVLDAVKKSLKVLNGKMQQVT